MRPTILETRAALAQDEFSAVELVQHTLEQIEQKATPLNAFLETFPESSRAVAAALTPDDDRPLAGLPIAVKDIICTVEGHTTAASQILQNFQSPFDATVIRKLKAAGAIIIGKTNLDEFAMGSSGEHSAFGPVKNPWDTSRVAGGSSAGSGAAVGSGSVLAALGTDTGGSIRVPASFCNVVGLKPTYGRVSRFGCLAYASSFDQVGPFARTVADAALLFGVLAGPDPLDATSSTAPVDDYLAACQRPLSGLKIGLPQEYFSEDINPAMQALVRAALKILEEQGAVLQTISLPLTYAAVPTYYLLVKAEASSNLACYDGLRYGRLDLASPNLLEHYLDARGQHLGPEVKRSILMGTYALSAGYVDAWYKQASRVRTLIRREFAAAFEEVDIIAGPVAPEPAFPLASKTQNPLAMYLVDLLTVPASVAGLPALSVPAGFIAGLPAGLQLIAPSFQEARLFQTAYAYEQMNPWWQESPSSSLS
jgi:aspartyl-tRNA(Asn)/glutamyl-tRNA(Gln) amidotransferase subunit A